MNIITSGGVSPELGAMITCGVIIMFTLLAGMVSIVSIDVFNGIVMIGSVVLAVPFALNAAGGWTGVAEAIPADHFAAFGSRNWIWAVGVFFPTFFLLLGESSIYQKFFSAESERAARRAVIGMIIGVVVIETLLAAVSVIGSALHWNDPTFVDAAATAAGALAHDAPTTETIILQVAFENLPVIMGALLLSGGVAIILSTGNTFLMVPATNLTRDIYQRFIKPDADDRAIILFQRVSIAVLGVVALLLATQFTTILAMAFTAYTMVGAGITPALLAAFLWRRTTTAGGVSSIVAGMGVTVFITIVNWFHQRSHGEPFLETDYIIIPAATASILALVLVSLATAKPPREKWEPFHATANQSTAT